MVLLVSADVEAGGGSIIDGLDPDDKQRLSETAGVLKSRLVMKKWLEKHKWRFVYDELVKVGVNSLQGMADYAEDDEAKLDMLSNFQVKMRFFVSLQSIPLPSYYNRAMFPTCSEPSSRFQGQRTFPFWRRQCSSRFCMKATFMTAGTEKPPPTRLDPA